MGGGNIYPDNNLRNMTIDIINACNLACRLCYTESSPAKQRLMPTDKVIALLDRIRRTVRNVTFTGGEALLHPGVEEIARCASAHFDNTSILSNATHITDAQLDWLAGFGIHLGVSIDGPQVHHDRQRGPGSFKKAVHTLLRAHRRSIRFWIQTVIGKFTDEDFTFMVRLAETLGAYGVAFQRPKLSGRVNRDTTHWMNPSEYREAVLQVHRLNKQHPDMSILIKDALFNCEDSKLYKQTELINDGSITGGCRAGLTYLYVKSNGDVLSCPFIPASQGNIFERDIYDIWQNGPELAQLRDESNHKTCLKCHNFRVCRGCRAEALAWTQDLMGEDPNCWQKTLYTAT